MKNWSNTVTFSSSGLAEPRSVEELSQVVATSPRVRALGTRHSFSAIADTDGLHVSTGGIPVEFEIDEHRGVVRIDGGPRYASVATFLTDNGWALHNMGSLPHIAVAGAISTGTHGSGSRNGGLATAVRGLRLVGPDGAPRWVRAGDPAFPGSVVALGLLGVIVGIELAIEPSYLVRQDVYRSLAWPDLLRDVRSVTDAGYSVSVFTDWVSPAIDQIWVKRRLRHAEQTVPDDLVGAHRETRGDVQVVESGDDNTTRQGLAGAWSAHLPHFRIDRTPSQGDEIQSEYFVALDSAREALAAVREVALGHADAFREFLVVSELRTQAADSLWLSEAFERDSLAIHFTFQNRPEAVRALCTHIERALAPFSARPHWGKVHTMAPAAISDLYPRLPAFRRLRDAIDPERKFVGDAVADLLSLS